MLKKSKVEDKGFQRVILILQFIILSALAAVIVIINTITSLAHTTSILALLIAFIIVSIALTVRGYLVPGRVLVPLSVVVTLTMILYYGNGLHDTAIVGFPVVLLLGGMMIGRKGLWPLTLFCSAAVAFVGYAEMGGWLPEVQTLQTGWDDILINMALLGTAASVMNLLMKQMEDNLTQARLSETELKLSEERFRVFMDTSPAIVIMKDHDGRYVYCNNKMETLLGKSASEVIGKTEFDLFPAAEAEQFTASDRQVMESGRPVTMEYSAHDLRGVLHDWWVFKFPMLGSDGKTYVGMQIMDVTERNHAEETRKRTEELYRRAIITAGAVPYYLDHRTRTYTYMGEGIKPLTGYSVEEMTPDLWNSLEQEGFPRGDLADLTYAEADQLTEEDNAIPWECDYRILNRNGETRWVADTSVKGANEFGEVVGVIGILQDITDRKTSEIEREKLIQDLELRNSELERFTYTVSHDLKSPLVTIKGYIGYIKNDLANGNIERVLKDLQRINDAAQRMQNLLNDLLELSRVGRLINPPVLVPFEEIVQEALHNVAGQIEEKNVKVRVASDLPTITVDRPRFVEVMQNLIDNACKYMGNQPDPQIHIGCEIMENEFVFHVKDNGIGIEPQFHTKVFGLFNKLNPSSEGTGVGLALIKRIIELHNGKVGVDSDGNNKGSTFYFTLPSQE